MDIETLYLGLFVAGLTFAVASFLLGFGHAHLHLPHGHPHLPHSGVAHPHAAPGARGLRISPFNVSTTTAFVTWFGGTGYILGRLGVMPVVVIPISVIGGLAGASLILAFLSRVVLPAQTAPMRAEDYRMEGTLARVSLPMVGTRTGEVTYTRHGATRSEGARSADGGALPRGTEVVITRYERGIAYVEPFDRLLAERAFMVEQAPEVTERSAPP